MRLHYPHPFRHVHDPLRMDFLAWTLILLGVIIALLLQGEFR